MFRSFYHRQEAIPLHLDEHAVVLPDKPADFIFHLADGLNAHRPLALLNQFLIVIDEDGEHRHFGSGKLRGCIFQVVVVHKIKGDPYRPAFPRRRRCRPEYIRSR